MTDPKPFDPMNYDEYTPDDFIPNEPKNYKIERHEPTRAELAKSHLRIAAADAILSPVGRVAIPDISTRVKLANNVLHGEKNRAEKAAQQARQAFPAANKQTRPEATIEVTGQGLGPKGRVHDNSTTPGLNTNAHLGR